MDEDYKVPHLWVRQFGSVRLFDPETMILIDDQFVIDHPELVADKNRAKILQSSRDRLRK
jgi:hypothetical protein